MIGAPVRTLALAAARWVFSMFSVTPGSSAATLMKAAFTSEPWMPFFDVVDEAVRHGIGVAQREVGGQVLVGVDAGARHDLEAGLLARRGA